MLVTDFIKLFTGTAMVLAVLLGGAVFAYTAADTPADPEKVVTSIAVPPVKIEDVTNPDTYVRYMELAKDIVIARGPGVLMALAIFVLGRWMAMWISAMAGAAFGKAGLDLTLKRFLAKLIYYVILAGVVIAAAGQLGIETTSFVAIVGAAGLAVGLALKDSLANFASGVMLILFRPFKVDDAVTTAGVTGKVLNIDIFSTVILTADNQRIIIPNSAITSSVITNTNAEETRRIDLVVGIGYDDDLKLAKDTLAELIQADSRILAEPKTTIAVSDLAASSVDIIVRPWVTTGNYWDVRLDLIEKIKLTFDERGISFPYPQQDVHMYSKDK